jgi:phage terminase large subunit-like protein
MTPEALRTEIEIGQARRNLADYSRYVHNIEPAAHHQMWIDKFMQPLVEEVVGERRVLLIAPPGSAKSTYATTILPEWYIGNHKNDALFIGSATAALAQEFLGSIKRTIEENGRYHEVFPDIFPDYDEAWSAGRAFVRRDVEFLRRPDPSFIATGPRGGLIGRRLNGAIIDDLVDQDRSKSETEMQDAKDWIEQTLLSRMLPTSFLLHITTRWTLDDVANLCLDPTKRFVVCVIQAIQLDTDDNPGGLRVPWYTLDRDGKFVERGTIHENGPSYWPEFWPAATPDCRVCGNPVSDIDPFCLWCLDNNDEEHATENSLAKKKAEVDHRIWMTMYQAQPGEGELTHINRRGVRYYCPLCKAQGSDEHRICDCPEPDVADFRDFARTLRLTVLQAADPAFTENKRSDPTADITAGVATDTGDIYVLDAEKKVTNDPVGFIDQKWNQWVPVHSVVIETVAAAALITADIRAQTMMPVKDIPTQTDKTTRALGLGIHYRNRRVLHPARASWRKDFEKSVFGVPMIDDWHYVDAMGFLALEAQSVRLPRRGRRGRLGRVTVGAPGLQSRSEATDAAARMEDAFRRYEESHHEPHPGAKNPGEYIPEND